MILTGPWPRYSADLLHRLDAPAQPISQFVSARLYELRSQITAGKILDDDERTSLLQRLLKYRTSITSQESMSDQDIISEAMGHTCVFCFPCTAYSDVIVPESLAWIPLPSL